MSYRVLWSPDAEQQLEALLQDLAAQSRIAAAAQEIDLRILASPLAFGESRFEGLRIGFAPPLGVYFEILDDVKTAIVYDVWRTDSKRR